MKRALALCAFALATTVFASSALADTFSFTFGGPHDPIYGFGTITATATGNTTSDGGPIYKVTAVTGTTGGQAITGILDPGTFPIGSGFGAGNDNLLSYPASFDAGDSGGDAYFDASGLSYELANGDYFNIAENDDQSRGGNYTYFNFYTWSFQTQSYIQKTSDEEINVTADSSPVPEPESLALFGTGLIGVVGLIRRRFHA